jgi:stress-induced morphogen
LAGRRDLGTIEVRRRRGFSVLSVISPREEELPYTPDQLKQAIENGLPGATAHVEDVKGTGDHFDAVVISPDFEGKSPVEQHRMVHRAMKEIIEGDLHAFHLKTLTPDAAERGR